MSARSGPRDAYFRELSGTDISVYDRIPTDVLGDEKGNCVVHASILSFLRKLPILFKLSFYIKS